MKIAAVIIVVLLLAQVGAAREDSSWVGPGSSFYPLKIWMEKFRLNFVFNQTEKTQTMLGLAEERLRDAESVQNNSEAFNSAMDEYASQLEEINNIIKNDTQNETKDIRVNITEKIEDHKKRTNLLKNTGRVTVIQQSIVEASSSSGESKIKVSVVDGNVSVETDGGNPVVTRDGSNVTVISETNNSRQQVIVRSSRNDSSSSSVVVSQSSSVAVSGN
ncbi:Uncharacterised protein [uncultured archaeon]|nr:Uncharacterised protein [uncultured archaeon]